MHAAGATHAPQANESNGRSTVTILRVGSNEKYAEGWDRAFGGSTKKKAKTSKTAKSAKAAKKKTAKKKAKKAKR